MLLITFLKLLFLENCVMPRGLWQALSPLPSCFMVFIFLFSISMGDMLKGSPFLNTKQGDLLGGRLFTLAHYRAFLGTIRQARNYVFPSLANDTHIVGSMNEITHAFEHLSTQLTLLGLKVKVSKCKLWESIKDIFQHKDSLGLHFGHRWLVHFGCANEFSRLCHTFFR
jgi:hypothetical protein